ncbi:MAG: sensor histidine kinase [Parahaliea sp.]
MQSLPLRQEQYVDDAFRSLERVSRELDASYRNLQSKIERLNQELAASRSARLNELAEKEHLFQRLSSLMALLPGGVLLLDAQGLVRDANPQALTLYGEPLVGEPWEQVCARALKQADGHGERRVSVASRVLDDSGEAVVLVTDTTELHQLQAQVGRERRLRDLGEMAARMTHEIRTPLASLTLYLSQLRSRALANARREQICDTLSFRLGEIESLIQSVLGFVRGDAVPFSRVVVREALQSFEELMQPGLVATGSRLELPVVDHTLVVSGVREDLVAALCNLATNAIDAGAGRPVTISVWAGAISRERMQLRVADNGPGIDPAIVDRLFDPFFTTRATGVGLGLAVVDKTVAAMGGEVRVNREHSKGSEFIVELPLQAVTEDAWERN